MALESGTYISDLVPSNPAHTDGVNQADSHMRLIKATLKATFPNIAGAVTASHTVLNTVADAFATAGSLVLSGTTALTLSNSSGNLGVSGRVAATGLDTTGSITLAGVSVGAFLVPSGGIIAWSGAIAAIPAGWVICDGNNGTPDLRGRFIIGAGGSYAPYNTGGAAASLSDVQGAHTHGGYTGAAGAFSASVSTDAQGGHGHGGNTLQHALTNDEIPSHSHQQAVSASAQIVTSTSGTTSLLTSINGNSAIQGPYTGGAGAGAAHTHGISTDGQHTHNVAISQAAHSHSIAQDGAHQHTVPTMPPYFALCFIMKT
ncbi:hypothetical protein [Asaia sp. HN128]|uniref:hypothetical protein n=1 Tax=Asaia sp. HN128 TaxID=3081234 RepID=UPI0030186BF9